MRRVLILALLFGVVQLIVPLGTAGEGAETLLSFGFLILAAYTVGEMAPGLGIPRIVGYLVAGLVCGPSLTGAVSAEAVHGLAPVSQLAIALIAFLAGAELRWSEVKERGTTLLRMMTAELAVTFVALAALVMAAHRFVPVLAGRPFGEVAAFALLFASIAIVHSPSVAMALLSETGARGPVARTTLGIVLLADVAVVIVFSATATLVHDLLPAGGSGGGSPALLIWEICGAILVGALLGGAVAIYLRLVARELTLFAILVAFLGSEIARLAHVETLLTLLVAGFVTENLSPAHRGDDLRRAMMRSAAPVFVVFFALSGAKIDLGGVASVALVAVPIALVRIGGIWLGTRLGARWAGAGELERRYVWMGLVSQAGVAIGLATIVGERIPVFGPEMRTLLLGIVALNETVGPLLFRRALGRSGEVPGGEVRGGERLTPAPAAARTPDDAATRTTARPADA